MMGLVWMIKINLTRNENKNIFKNVILSSWPLLFQSAEENQILLVLVIESDPFIPAFHGQIAQLWNVEAALCRNGKKLVNHKAG